MIRFILGSDDRVHPLASWLDWQIKRPLLLCIVSLMIIIEPLMAAPEFQSALPVWPEGRAEEMNVFAEFRAEFAQPDPGPAMLRVTGATQYRIHVNGEYAGYGPARAGHGFFRVDEIDVTRWLRLGANSVVIEVAGYNSNGYSLLDQPSFLQAEVLLAGKVIAATGVTGFEARVRPDRIQKTQRYSFQRPFSEIWRVPATPSSPVACSIVEAKVLEERRVPYSTFEVRKPVAHLTEGEMAAREQPAKPWKDRSLTAIGPKLKGFPEAELTFIPSLELQTVATVSSRPAAPGRPRRHRSSGRGW